MTYEEIVKLLQYNEKETNLYMPNEIFENLQNNIKNAPHIGFAYSYLYLTQWLYRHAKYFNVPTVIDNTKIKEVLGYSSTTKTLNYLIKKDGLLDEIGLLETTRNYPISWEWSKGEDLEFLMSSEYGEFSDHLPSVPKRFFLKKPLKGFDRVAETEDGEGEDILGVFYSVENTHNIPFETFVYCMSNKDIGCTGFYLYCYLSHRNDIHVGGVDVSLINLAEETGISYASLNRALGALKSYNLVSFRHNQEFFAIGMIDKKSNTYITNQHYDFGNTPTPFKRIPIMKKKDYFEMLKESEAPIVKIDFNLDELPF